MGAEPSETNLHSCSLAHLQIWGIKFPVRESLIMAVKATIASRWPLSLSALFDTLFLTITAELLQGRVGDVILTLFRVAVQWASWWVLP